MLNLEQTFKPSYSYYLEKVIYQRIPDFPYTEETAIKINDELNIAIKDKGVVTVLFSRSVYFSPDCMFNIKIVYGADLTFVCLADSEKYSIEEIKESLLENNNPYLGGLIARTSLLLAQITASYGQSPLVTPPSFLKNEK